MGKLVKVGVKVRAPEGSSVLAKWRDTQLITGIAEGGDRLGVVGTPDAEGKAPILKVGFADQNDLMQLWCPDAGDPLPKECSLIIHPLGSNNSIFGTLPWAITGHPRDTSGDNSDTWNGSAMNFQSNPVFDPGGELGNTIDQLIQDTNAAKDAANQAAQAAQDDTNTAINTLTGQVNTAVATISPAVQAANQAAQDARDSAGIITFATDAERNAATPPDDTWSRTLRATADGWDYHRRESSAWVLKYEEIHADKAGGIPNFGGIIVPFYHYLADVYTDTEFQKLIGAMREYRKTQFLVVHNPASGPGATADANIQVSIQIIDGAGGQSLGYCDTNYGARSANDVKADFTQWNALYQSIDGVFLDQVGYAAGDTTTPLQDAKRLYYKQLIADLFEAGAKYVIANAGAPLLAEWYADGVFGEAIVVITENTALPTEADMAGFGSTHLYWPRNKRAVLLNTQASQPDLSVALDYYGWLGVTDSANYDTLPAWFDQFAATVEGRVSGVPTGPQPSYLRQIQQTDDSNSADLPTFKVERNVPISNYTPALHAIDLSSGGGYAVGLQYSFTRSTGTLFSARSLALGYDSFHIEIWGRMTTLLFGTSGAGRTVTFDPLTAALPTSRRRGHDQGGGSLQPGDLFLGNDGHFMIALGGGNGYYQGAKVPFRLANYADVSALPTSGSDLLAGSLAYLTTPPIGKSRLVYWNGSNWIHAGSDNWPEVPNTVPSNALYIGQIALDVASEKFYVAMATGTANDFKEIGGGGSSPQFLTFVTASYFRGQLSSLDDVDESGAITCTGILTTDKILNVQCSAGDSAGIHVQARVTANDQVNIAHFGTGVGFVANGNTTAAITVLRS